jgi:hypothetical protein
MLDSLLDKCQNIWDSIISLPNQIYSMFDLALLTLSETLNGVYQAVMSVPSAIVNGIKEIFIPDTAVIET